MRQRKNRQRRPKPGLKDVRVLMPEIRWILRPEKRTVVLLGLTTVPVGFLTALVVALVAQTAVALAAERDVVRASLGSIDIAVHVRTAIIVGLVVAAVIVVQSVLGAYLRARLLANSEARLRQDMFRRFVGASWALQSREREGHLQEVMVTQVNRSAFLIQSLAKGLIGFITWLGLIISAFVISPGAAGAMLVIAAFLFVSLRPMARVTHRYARLHVEAAVAFAEATNETVKLSEEHHVFGTQDAQVAFVDDRIEEVRAPWVYQETYRELSGGIYANLVVFLLVVGLAGLYVLPVSDLGSIGAVVLILLRSLTSGSTVQSAYTSTLNHLPYLKRTMGARERYGDAAVTGGTEPLGRIESFRFDDVSYSYDADQPAVTGLSFAIPAGTVAGVVGPSGAGKSTLVQLLLRLREPQQGRYLVNGREAADFDLVDWSRLVTYVPQEPKLLHGTIADNIRFHRIASDEDVERAARQAHLHDEIVAFPEGYDRIIGQGGAAVSGGQRQRLCIARALLTEPEVIVLDEPTSALDPRSERLVQQSLEDLRDRGVTFFIIAHRPATLEFIDQLLVMREGQLVAVGPPDEVTSDNRFARETLTGTVSTDH